jgi:hypothetical protein
LNFMSTPLRDALPMQSRRCYDSAAFEQSRNHENRL